VKQLTNNRKIKDAMSVKLRKKKNGDGTTSLYLDIYNNGVRSYEFLKQFKLQKGKSESVTEQNKKNFETAQLIAAKRGYELGLSDYQLPPEDGKKTIVTVWMQSYIDRYKKKDVRNMQGVLNRFKDFLEEDKRAELTFAAISEQTIIDFQDRLKSTCKGEGSASYFSRFKKMMRVAHRKNLIDRNPCDGVRTWVGKSKKKDVLTLDEIKHLASTHTESVQVRNAFLFCCSTGLRWADVKNLTWDNISGHEMTIYQSKNDGEVHINLNKTALKLIGEPGEGLVFQLPSANGCNKTLRAWVKRAGIKKKITWHCSRHSFGTNLIFHGTDLITASSLLGHSTVKHTQRYVRSAQQLKETATSKLEIDL
jgi:site-specific recombinase XerD